MNIQALLRRLHQPAASKIVLVVADGLGGLPPTAGGKTELETAHTPHLDALARAGACGLGIPVCPGVTPGAGVGQLALLGYDPLETPVARGVLEALGVGFPLQAGDVAARGDFCTRDAAGSVIDPRGGRPVNERGRELCQRLAALRIPGVELFVEPLREHRFVLVLRGGDAARGADEFAARAAEVLRAEAPTNGVRLRGFGQRPQLVSLRELYGVRAVALARLPLLVGLARLVGMAVADTGPTLGDQAAALRRWWDAYDLFVLHYAHADSAGRAGHFAAKVQMIERLDGVLPQIQALDPDVLIVTGGYCTPSVLGGPSWHPVPTLLWARTGRPDGATEFGETACARGGLGLFPLTELLALALGHAGRLRRFGG